MYANPVNEILKDKQVTQGELAEKLHVHVNHLNGVINGRIPSGILRHRISKKLGQPVDTLWPKKTGAS